MVGVIVTFQFGDDFDRSKLEGIARGSAHKFEGLPGLRSKVFTVDEQARRALNFYLWESEEAARGFFTPELAASAEAVYGMPPTNIEFVDVVGVVDNSRSVDGAVA